MLLTENGQLNVHGYAIFNPVVGWALICACVVPVHVFQYECRAIRQVCWPGKHILLEPKYGGHRVTRRLAFQGDGASLPGSHLAVMRQSPQGGRNYRDTSSMGKYSQGTEWNINYPRFPPCELGHGSPDLPAGIYNLQRLESLLHWSASYSRPLS